MQIRDFDALSTEDRMFYLFSCLADSNGVVANASIERLASLAQCSKHEVSLAIEFLKRGHKMRVDRVRGRNVYYLSQISTNRPVTFIAELEAARAAADDVNVQQSRIGKRKKVVQPAEQPAHMLVAHEQLPSALGTIAIANRRRIKGGEVLFDLVVPGVVTLRDVRYRRATGIQLPPRTIGWANLDKATVAELISFIENSTSVTDSKVISLESIERPSLVR